MRWAALMFLLLVLGGCIEAGPEAAMDPACREVEQPLEATGVVQGPQTEVVKRVASAFRIPPPTEKGQTIEDVSGDQKTEWLHPDGRVFVLHDDAMIHQVTFQMRGARYDHLDAMIPQAESAGGRLGIDTIRLQVTTNEGPQERSVAVERVHEGQSVDKVLSLSVVEPSVVFGREPMTRYDVLAVYEWPCDPYPAEAAERVAKQVAREHHRSAGLPGPLASTPSDRAYVFEDGILEIRLLWPYGDTGSCDATQGGRIDVRLDGFNGTPRNPTHSSTCAS